MAEPSACAWNDDPVSDYGIGVFQCSIYGHSLERKSVSSAFSILE